MANCFRMLKEGGDCEDVHLVSAVGASTTSKIWGARIKGEAEEGIKACGFNRVSVYRPRMLLTTTRAQPYFGEKIWSPALRLMDKGERFSVTTENLGRAIVINSLRKLPPAPEGADGATASASAATETLEHKDIVKVHKDGSKEDQQ